VALSQTNRRRTVYSIMRSLQIIVNRAKVLSKQGEKSLSKIWATLCFFRNVFIDSMRMPN
jgi:hypothetical protein